MSCPVTFHLIPLRQGLTLNSEIFLSLPTTGLGFQVPEAMPNFFWGAADLNPGGHHACAAGTLTH